jgi:hypothetical protein
MRQARDAGQSPAAAWGQQEKALEIDRTLCRFRQAGIQATYHCCDVADGRQLAGVLEQIRQLDGPIEGVLHGAGVAVDAWFTRKKREHVLRTIATKVDGAAALMQLTANDPLRYFVAFGSLSGRFGAKGQSDYCAANDMLCKLIDWFRMQRPECAAVGIHWHAWDEVGMAMKPELKAMFESIKLTLMPTAEGIGHLTAELLALAPEPEVIFTEQEHYRKSYPLNVLASTEDVQETPCKPRVTQALERVAAITPLIDQLLEHDEGRRLVAEARLDPSADPFLIEHRMGGKPILPAVIAMELMAEAGSLLARESGQVVGLRSLNILTGLVCASDAPRTVRVTAEATGAGISCCLISDHYDRRGRLVEANRTLATGTVEIASVTSSESVPYAGQPPLGWYPLEYPSAFTVQHGPKFRCLKNLFCQYDGGFGRIIAPPIAELAGGRSDRGWFLPPAVLDGCLVACSTYTFVMFQRRVEIPLGLQHLRLVRLPRPAEECSVRMYFRGQDTSETRYDFVLFGDDQGVILSAQGYRSAAVSKSQK